MSEYNSILWDLYKGYEELYTMWMKRVEKTDLKNESDETKLYYLNHFINSTFNSIEECLKRRDEDLYYVFNDFYTSDANIDLQKHELLIKWNSIPESEICHLGKHQVYSNIDDMGVELVNLEYRDGEKLLVGKRTGQVHLFGAKKKSKPKPKKKPVKKTKKNLKKRSKKK